jgi:hypothetical protein
MDRVVTFVGGPYHGVREYRHDVPASIDKPGEGGPLHRYEVWTWFNAGRVHASRESTVNATYVLQGLSDAERDVAIRSLSSPPFVMKEDE